MTILQPLSLATEALGGAVSSGRAGFGVGTASAIAPGSIISLWAWDNATSRSYFYAPSLVEQGGKALTDYITSKDFLDFTTANRTLGPGVGFWVNKH